MFHDVADRYDLMNDLMSGGVHRLWKDAMVARLAPPKTGTRALSRARHGRRHRRHRRAHPQCLGRLCRGHGQRHQFGHAAGRRRAGQELALRRRRRNSSRPMPRSCRSRTRALTPIRSPSASATCRASSKALSEAYRVLKRGGRFLVLEFSPGRRAGARPASTRSGPTARSRRSASAVTGDAQPYQYLVESIRKFPHARQRFAAMIDDRPVQAVTHTADDRQYRGAASRAVEALSAAWGDLRAWLGLLSACSAPASCWRARARCR